MRTLSLYPAGDKVYEKTEDNTVIIRYKLENDFEIWCTYVNDSMVAITVGNTETHTVSTADSSESMRYKK